MKYSLTLEQIDSWRDLHYLLVDDYFNVEEKRALLEWTDELIVLPEEPNKWMHTYEFNSINPPRLSSIEHFLEKHNRFNQMAQCAKLNTLLSTLMEETVTLFQENVQFWNPGHKGVPPRQDAFELNTVGPSHHITMMVGLDKGVIHLPYKFKYQQKLLAQRDGQLTAKLANKTKWTPLEYYTGDLLLLDSYLPYYIPPNDSELTRRAIFISYNKKSDGGSKRDAFYQKKRLNQAPNPTKPEEKTYA